MSLEFRRKYNDENEGKYSLALRRYGSYWNGRIKVLTITPKDQKEGVPKYAFLPGYIGNNNPEISKKIATQLAVNSGGVVDIITVSGYLPGRRLSKQAQEAFPNEPKKNNVRKSGISSLEINRAAAILQNLKMRGIKAARVIAHSLGVQSTALAIALDREGTIEDAVGVASAGINDKRPVKHIIRRFGVDSFKEGWHARHDRASRKLIMSALRASVALLVKHPIRFVWHEVRAAKYGNVAQKIINSESDMKFLTGTTDAVFGDKDFSKDLAKAKEMVIYQGGHNRIYTDRNFVRDKALPLFKPRVVLAA